MFWCVSYHLGPLCFLTKLGAKQSELVQKIVPRSRTGILRNECTRSTTLEPKLLFCCVLYHLGAFGTIKSPYETRAKHSELVQKFVPRSHVGIFHNKCTRSTPLDPKFMVWCVSYHFGAFGTIWLPCQSRSKTYRTSAKVCAMKSHWNFSQRTHPIEPIGP